MSADRPPALTTLYYIGRPTHFRTRPAWSQTPACGLGALELTTEAQDVTCGNCHRTKAWRAVWQKWKAARGAAKVLQEATDKSTTG